MQRLLPWLVLFSSLCLSYVLWDSARCSAQKELLTEFDFHSHEVVEHIKQRMEDYQQVLRGVRGLFSGSISVDRAEFHNYVASLDIEKHYPGLQGLSHATIVPHTLLSQHIAEMRKQGFADYTINPPGDREIYTPVLYIEPFNDRNAHLLGYDTYVEPTRHAAMVLARDTGAAALTGKVTLVQETDEEIQAGFLMFMPLYRNGFPHETLAERRANITGWVTAVFRINDLIAGLEKERFSDLKLEIYDGDEISQRTRMYDSDGIPFVDNHEHTDLEVIHRIKIAGHPWTLIVQSSPKFEAYINRDKQAFIAIAGIAISLLLALLVHALMNAKTITRRLKDSEERWRYALEGAGDGVWDWNLLSNEMTFSRRWKEMLGYTDDEITNDFTEWEKRVHPDDLKSVMADIQAHVDGATPAYVNEHRLLCKDGSWKWILDRGMIMGHTPDGKPSRMIGTHADITARKDNETELKQQRDFTNAVIEVAGNVIVVLDMSGRFVRVNRAAEKLTGFSQQELLGQPVWDWVIPEDQKADVIKVFENLKAGNLEIATRYENDWQARDGSRHTLDWHNTILKNDHGEMTHIVSLGYDITERKLDEEIIQRLYRLYSSLSHCDHTIVHSSDQEELFPRICMEVVKHGGYRMAWIGLIDDESRMVRPVASYGDGTEYLQNLEISVDAAEPSGQGPTGIAIRENQAVWCQDFINDSRTIPWHERGERFNWGSTAALPLRINGVPVGAFNMYAGEVNSFDEFARALLLQMAADISFALEKFAHERQRKQAEAALNELNASLESRVRERTDELRKAKEQADAASQAKSDFLSNMSHEIRSPLTAILGFSESLLAKDIRPEDQEKAISTVVRNSKHLQQIINDILDLSKIEAGQLETERVDTSVFHVMGEVDALMGTGARDKGLEFSINYEFPLPRYILTDPTCLKQILINLCSNAIKFTDQGGLVLDVSCDREYRDIRFIVTDTGIGMTPEDVDRIFDPFAQADTSTTRKYGGTGLGLSISAKLANKLGGKLSCVSRKNHGSSFTLTITNHAADTAVPIHSLEQVFAYHDGLEEHVDIRQLQGRILLVEDSVDNQQLVSMYVEKTGASLTITENGREGVDTALASKYDLILMDMQMPVMDGVEATATLRKYGYTRPIVSLTANAMLSDRKKCMDAGADDYLLKPVDLKKFYDVLNKYLPQSEHIRSSVPETAADGGDMHADFTSSPRYLAIVSRFLEQLPQFVQELSDAARNRDWSQLEAKSHDLKGMGGAVGYPEITAVAARMNLMMKNKDHDSTRVLGICTELEELSKSILQRAGKDGSS